MNKNYSYFQNEKGDYTIAYKEGDYTQDIILGFTDNSEFAHLACKALNVLTSCTCLENLKDDEPFFVLRAQDQSSVSTLFEWLQLNPSLNDEKMNDAISLIQDFKAYPHKKVAD